MTTLALAQSGSRRKYFWAMTDLAGTISPMSWLLLHLGGLFPLWAIFHPSPLQLLCLIAVSIVDVQAILFLEKFLFSKSDPPVIPCEMMRPRERIDSMTLAEKVTWVEKLISFPARRARHCLLFSSLKAIPELLVIVLLWPRPFASPWYSIGITITLGMLLSTYLFGMIYIENHSLISDILADIHRRHDWSQVFARVHTPALGRHFRTHDYFALVALCGLVLFSDWIVIVGSQGVPASIVATKVVAIGLVGWILLSWLWYSSRGIFMRGLLRLFDELANFDPEKTNRSLPLHSTPILARFESSFNTLCQRVRLYHRELSHRVYLKTEESRYQALGEMAGLVVHDLSTPLHIIRFCLEQIEPSRFEGQERYHQQLQKSSQRAVELVDSLRAYIRNPRGKEVSVGFADAQSHVMRLLEVQFYSRGLSKVTVEVDPALNCLQLRVAKADLIHVLINLYANSIENLLANDTAQPKISVKLVENRGKQVLLSLRDNGTGLSADAFERLTALNPEPETIDRAVLGGLGLRLVRRLIERYHGALSVVDLPPDEKGTLFHFWLPSVPEVTESEIADVTKY